jgi:putative Mg2+ transporter-C (MgtC) family protein
MEAGKADHVWSLEENRGGWQTKKGSQMAYGELLARLLVGTILGAVIGYERQLHGRPAGLRTHLLVGLAATTFMIVSTHFVYFQHYAKEDLVAIDTSRIAASVVTGVGFLGGGAILRTGANVQGLTTAAGLWLVAAIGLSAGGGMYAISGAATAIGVGALTVLRRFERKEDDTIRRRIALTLDESAPPLTTIFAALNAKGILVATAEYEKHIDERRVHVVFQVRLPRDASDVVISVIEMQPGVRRIRMDSPE